LPAGSKETQLTRFQYANHLDTACLELDAAGQIISYEEYYPFGSTSYQGTDQVREVPAKRYRYIGRERDDDSGFLYCGRRYYASWLARWISPDPTGVKDGPNLYTYCRDNPVILHDTSGTQGDPPQRPQPPAPQPASNDNDAGGDDEDDPTASSPQAVDPGNFPFANPTSGLGIMRRNSLDLDVTIGGALTTGIPDPAGANKTLLGGGLNLLQLSWRQQTGPKGFDLGLAIGTSQLSGGGSAASDFVGSYFLTPTADYGHQWKSGWGIAEYLQVTGGFRQGQGVPDNARGFAGFSYTNVIGREPQDALFNLDINFPVFSYQSTGSLNAGPTLRDLATLGTQVSGTFNLEDQHWALTVEGYVYGERGGGFTDTSPGASAVPGPGAWGVRYGLGVGLAHNYREPQIPRQTSTLGINLNYFRENVFIDPSAGAATVPSGIATNTFLATLTFAFRKP
jgi:RHS repeat-associated protein